jgi:GNAT superfamily N-acetyltransferase
MRTFTIAQRPELIPEFVALDERSWPEFMHHGDIEIADDVFYSDFGEYQIAIVNESEQLVAAGQTLPVHWSGINEELPETMNAVMQDAIAYREATAATSTPVAPQMNYLCAFAAIVDESVRGQGMSRTILLEMLELARRNGLLGLVAPVRPSFKSKHPTLSIEEYADWRREDGQLYDPWLRTHERLGAKRLGLAARAFSVIASVADWQRWTGITFEHTGAHVAPGAIVPVEINLENGMGTYVEPSVWYLHSL